MIEFAGINLQIQYLFVPNLKYFHRLLESLIIYKQSRVVPSIELISICTLSALQALPQRTTDISILRNHKCILTLLLRINVKSPRTQQIKNSMTEKSNPSAGTSNGVSSTTL